VLIACYLAFVPLDKGLPLSSLPSSAGLVLSAGTTLGIAALVVVAIPPSRPPPRSMGRVYRHLRASD
jgi:hypothetical protein